MTKNNIPQEIPEMNLDTKYSTQKPVIPQNTIEAKKELEKTKKELEKLKSFITKKYPFTQAIGIIPPQAIKILIDEEEVPKETENMTHLYMIIPEENYIEKIKVKEGPPRRLIDDMKKEIIKEVEKIKDQKIWLQIKSPVDIWESCLDSKFELAEAIAMSIPLYDKGILQSLRLAQIHKSLVLRKFEKYVVSYIVGGSLVRGDVVKESDVDVFVIINDTDVKRMPRLELKERLRGIIYQYISEASALAGVKDNLLNVQIYLLTDFWESVKDAHPVMFTFIRDGIPLYDRGTFLPWKALLRMGKLKPSPEAIDMFMSMGDKTVQRAKKALMDILIHDIYWSILTPSQALLMLHGLPPPTTKEVVKQMTDTFVKEKMLEKRYVDILERVVKAYKDYEHEKLKEIKGVEIDKMLEDIEDFLKRLKELRTQIEKKSQEKTIEQIHKDVFELLKSVIGQKSQEKTIESFEKDFIKKGKFPPQDLKILKNIVEARKQFKKGKLDAHKVDSARKEATILINDLIEYSQRSELMNLERGKMQIKYGKNKFAEIVNCKSESFLLKENSIKKLTNTIVDSNMQELAKALETQKSQNKIEIDPKVFELVKKELGDFEIVL
ncbi:nucleotidyltransferase domain-containing protein [Nanoarchaeota archaeon]